MRERNPIGGRVVRVLATYDAWMATDGGGDEEWRDFRRMMEGLRADVATAVDRMDEGAHHA